MAQTSTWIFVCAMAALLALSLAGSESSSSESEDDDLDLPDNQCMFNQPQCGLCGNPIDVTLIARNDLVEPTFELTAEVKGQNQRELLSFIEQAAELEPLFKFKSTYYKGLGYFIDTFNGLTGSIPDETFWSFKSIKGDNVGSLECGATSYVPVHGETILFNFTTYTHAFPNGHTK